MSGVRLAVDIGGTFSDLILMDGDGRVRVRKVSSTPDDYADGVLRGVQELLAEAGVVPEAVEAVIHSTTVATNTILQRAGEPTALITTRGFRDVLELGRIRLPVLYNLSWEKPRPLVDRRHRLEVEERISARGEVLRPLDPAGVQQAVAYLQAQGIRSVAICLINSYVNPVHELELAAALRRGLPGVEISVSAEVLPEVQEFERTSTTAADAYVKPALTAYLRQLERGLRSLGVKAPVAIMHSGGGLLALNTAAARPVLTIESGPAAGVVAAHALAAAAGVPNAITFDMGGTTAKASLIEDGAILRSSEYEVGGEISASSRLIRGSGYLIRIPAVDVSEVGNGGGSLVRVDRGGRLQIGPRSAGAVPGPACYGLGNDLPTVTDANVVLGYLNPEYLAGGSKRIDAERSRRAVQEHVAAPLGLDLAAAAHGIHLLTVSNMIRAVRTVSVERGRDPRDFVLIAFGGNGPVHASTIARALGMRRVIIPPYPGLFSAVGLLAARFELPHVRSLVQVLGGPGGLDGPGLAALIRECTAEAADRYQAGGHPQVGLVVETALDLRYRGQSSHLTLPVPDRPDPDLLTATFHAEHQRTFGYASPEDPVEVVSIRATVRSAGTVLPWLQWHPARNGGSLSAAGVPGGDTRPVYFGPEFGWCETPVVGRADLGSIPLRGPLIVEEYDATTVVPPDATAALDPLGNIDLNLNGG